jgi:predicted component of type VI protein secretion system
MPYVAVKIDKQETDYRELTESTLIGRAPDCDIQIRDILLSRHHCRLEPVGNGWRVSDLTSKNGTIINGQKLAEPVLLKESDIIRVGRSKIVFHAGALEKGMTRRAAAPVRAADPSEALAGTLAGFTLLMPGESEAPPANMPTPQPKPKEPVGLEKSDVRELLTAIASSSWDSIYAEARQQTVNAGEGGTAASEAQEKPKRRERPRSPVDLSLQADVEGEEKLKPGSGVVDENILHVSDRDAEGVEVPEIAVPGMDVASAEVSSADVASMDIPGMDMPGAGVEESPRMEYMKAAAPVGAMRMKRQWRMRISRRAVWRPLSWMMLAAWIAAVATLFTWWTTHTDGSQNKPQTPSVLRHSVTGDPQGNAEPGGIAPAAAGVPSVDASGGRGLRMNLQGERIAVAAI